MRKFVLLTFLILAFITSCTSQAQEVQPTQELEEAPAAAALTELVVEGTAQEPASDVYELATQVDPGDSLRVEATVSDTGPGSITIRGDTRPYTPGSSIIFLVNIPDTLASSDIEITVETEAGDQLTYILRLANPGPNFRPAVNFDLPENAYAGQSLTIPLEAKSLSGDIWDITEVEQVFGLGDRYAGNEYVTSQELAELAFSGGSLSFLANAPGNYRLNITITNGSNTQNLTTDVPIYWEPGQNPFPIRGLAIDTWGPPDYLDLDNIPTVIDTAAEYGANYIQLAPYWNAAGTERDNEIVPCTVDAGCTTPDDQALRAWIQYAHSKDLKVLLKPHLIGGVFDRNTSSYDFDGWEIRPSDPDKWFADYTDFIVHYAKIAQEENVDMFAVGNELNGTQLDVPRWTNVITAVKEVYDGPLTYSDPLLWQIWDGQSKFWDQLDYIGIPYYYLGPNTTTPLIPDIEAEIQRVQTVNLTRSMNNFETALIATEFGRPNFDGTSHDFVTWSNTMDNQESVDYMEAGMLSMVELGPRFEGMFVWKLGTAVSPGAIDWDIRGKPLAEAIRFWFSN
jgi:hypothetical protein